MTTRRRRVIWLWLVPVAAGVLVILAGLRFLPSPPGAVASLRATETPPTPTVSLTALLLRPAAVRVQTPGFWSWALLDRRTGEVSGSANLAERSTTASMIKVWLAADYLRRASAAGEQPTDARLRLLSTMIRDSDNDAAWTMWRELGEAATIQRLVSTCALTDSRPGSRWSLTELSARDAARMGACIADGRAAGPQWTDWLLDEMRHVRGTGDFGIRKALPTAIAPQTAIKNGWILREEDGNWHLNCLGIGDGWVLAVLLRYPGNLGFAHGRSICQSITQQLLSAA
jgi:hypothetical protein